MNTRASRIIMAASSPPVFETFNVSIALVEVPGTLVPESKISINVDVDIDEPVSVLDLRLASVVKVDEISLQAPPGSLETQVQNIVKTGPVELQGAPGTLRGSTTKGIRLSIGLNEQPGKTVTGAKLITRLPIAIQEPVATMSTRPVSNQRVVVSLGVKEEQGEIESSGFGYEIPVPVDSTLWYRGFIRNMGRGMN